MPVCEAETHLWVLNPFLQYCSLCHLRAQMYMPLRGCLSTPSCTAGAVCAEGGQVPQLPRAAAGLVAQAQCAQGRQGGRGRAGRPGRPA